MQTNITDIYLINKKGSGVLKCDSNIKLNNISKEFKKLQELDYKVYLYNNITFTLDIKNNKKKCEVVEYVNNKLITNKLLVNSTIKELPVYSFPFVDKYNDIFNRHIISYQSGINIIRETNLKSNESVLFIRIENNQIDPEKVLKLIE